MIETSGEESSTGRCWFVCCSIGRVPFEECALLYALRKSDQYAFRSAVFQHALDCSSHSTSCRDGAIGSKITAQGVDPADAPLEQKIAWIKEAAGERFADLELSQTVYDLVITDSGTDLSPQAGGPPIPKRPLSTGQAVALLLEQRDRYGFSYLQVYEGQMENFAPVVARLAGT